MAQPLSEHDEDRGSVDDFAPERAGRPAETHRPRVGRVAACRHLARLEALGPGSSEFSYSCSSSEARGLAGGQSGRALRVKRPRNRSPLRR